MPAEKGHTPDKAKLTKQIEGLIQSAGQGADTSDLHELLHYIPHPWLTTVADWTFILQLVQNVEQGMAAVRASRQALITGVRQIGEAAGAQLGGAQKGAAGGGR